MKKFNYSSISLVKFYIKYFFYKILLFRDVRRGSFALYIAELIWLLNLFFKLKLDLPKKIATDYYETIFGKFYITPDLISTVAISPAFEREDMLYLLNRIGSSLKNGKKVLFLDIGAYDGLYTVAVGNRFARFNGLDIIAFEPDTEYLSLPTFQLLKKNVEINHIKNVKLKKIGIGSKKHVNKLGMNIDTMESILGKNFFGRYDEVFIKMDIDDFVIDGLKGIMSAAERAKKLCLFVEDFVKRSEVVKFLEKNDFSFETKISTYNSFWTK